ncbi:MAG: ATP-dependent RecD-like DNA helicase [Desulfovibrio sp.]|nr:MAG: ATP-dependent RecD-like DNA helicase [Desulfovibrio sp.]
MSTNDPHPIPLDQDLVAPELEELRGEIVRVTFTNRDSGWTVARVKVKGKKELVAVVGCMHDPAPGQTVKLRGDWVEDPKWGRQFKIEFCETALPETVEGIRVFLQSELVKGVGAATAGRIVKEFGEETLEVLDKEPERLFEVKKITKKQVEAIIRAWEDHKAVRDVMLFLQAHEISTGFALRIIEFYGPRALEVVQSNPYRLAMDLHGIGFLTADRIARKLGFPKDSELRAEAGAVYVLTEMAGKGHVLAPYEDFLQQCAGELEVEPALIEEAVRSLVMAGLVVREQPSPDCPEALYLKRFHVAEKGSADLLKQLTGSPKTVRPIEAEKAIEWVEKQQKIQLADRQKEAIRRAAANKVLVITGGPGTGKTTIIEAILRIFSAIKAKSLLAAPTGRAAKRMAEATGREAVTIHRLLEYSPQQGGFVRNKDNTLNCSLLIVDEASMMDTVLFYHLLSAVSPGTTLILVGDVNQLPSVGPGNVLNDVIQSGAAEVVELNEIFRQAQQSSIVMSAHAINRGDMPFLEPPQEGLSDFYFMQQDDPEQALAKIVEMVTERIPARFHLDPMDDVQVLAPMHKGVVGAINLNKELQRALNPEGPHLQKGHKRFRLNDKVMQVRNNYEKEIFNGDIGRVIDLDKEDKELVVRFDDRNVALEYAELDELEPAYAVTIHKSQGSEYPAVVVPIMTQHYIMLQRNLLYTAVTRGRKLVVLVGAKKALAIAVNNNTMLRRHTCLAARLGA